MPSPKELGALIRVERERQRYSVKSAAQAAEISRDTWRKVEAGASVHDTKRRAALDLLGLDDDALPADRDRSTSGPVSDIAYVLRSDLPDEVKARLLERLTGVEPVTQSEERDVR